jgi:hypothetical protein
MTERTKPAASTSAPTGTWDEREGITRGPHETLKLADVDSRCLALGRSVLCSPLAPVGAPGSAHVPSCRCPRATDIRESIALYNVAQAAQASDLAITIIEAGRSRTTEPLANYLEGAPRFYVRSWNERGVTLEIHGHNQPWYYVIPWAAKLAGTSETSPVEAPEPAAPPERPFFRAMRADFTAREIPYVNCETCGLPTSMLGTKRCDACWEVEQRLPSYLNCSPLARAFVERLLRSTPPAPVTEETIAAAARELYETFPPHPGNVPTQAEVVCRVCGIRLKDDTLMCIGARLRARAKG